MVADLARSGKSILMLGALPALALSSRRKAQGTSLLGRPHSVLLPFSFETICRPGSPFRHLRCAALPLRCLCRPPWGGQDDCHPRDQPHASRRVRAQGGHCGHIKRDRCARGATGRDECEREQRWLGRRY